MSHTEIDRLEVVQKITAKQITQVEAASLLGISYRQVKRIVKKYRQYGATSLVSKRRGKVANNRIASTLKQKALALIRDNYHDFAPTLAHEKLSERHGICCSVETLRKWMVEDNLWQVKTRRHACIHQPRARRAQFGELVQIDGSPQIKKGVKKEERKEERGQDACIKKGKKKKGVRMLVSCIKEA